MKNEILQAGMRLINHYNFFANKARKYGTDMTIYPSEIHLIDAIGLDGKKTTTILAETLGITKGGISQTTAKLMKKGLIRKSEGDGINEVYISLTESGKTAYEGHRKLHERLENRIDKLTGKMDEKTKAAIEDMIKVIDEELKRLEDRE